MTSKPKQSRSISAEEKAQRREDILDAAERVFFSTHYDKVSVGSIAKQAGLSRALMYVYFKDKSEICLAILVRASDTLRQRFADAFDEQQNGLQQITALGYAYYGFFRDTPKYFHLFADTRALLSNLPGEPSPQELQTLNILAETSRACMAFMVQALTNGVKDGSIDPEQCHDPLKSAYFLRGMLHGVILTASTDLHLSGANFSLEQLITHSIDNAVIALAAKPTS